MVRVGQVCRNTWPARFSSGIVRPVESVVKAPRRNTKARKDLETRGPWHYYRMSRRTLSGSTWGLSKRLDYRPTVKGVKLTRCRSSEPYRRSRGRLPRLGLQAPQSLQSPATARILQGGERNLSGR